MVRVGIAGTGFIGAIHARSARLAGGAPGRRRRLDARSDRGARRSARRRSRVRVGRGARHAPRTSTSCTSARRTTSTRRSPRPRSPPASTWSARSRWRWTAAQARRLTDAATGTGRQAAVPFVYRYYPTVREARERVRQGETGPLRLIHGTYLQDWLLRPEDDNWRVDEDAGGASRAFADIGSHWCDLAEFVGGQRITRLCARMITAVPDRERGDARAAFAHGDGSGERRSVGTEDAAVVQFETDGGAIGATVISQISAGRKNRLWLELDGAEESLAFDQELPESLWVGRREGDTLDQARSGLPVGARGAPGHAPRGSPAGLCGLLRRLRGGRLRRDRGRASRPTGMPVFADGLRAARDHRCRARLLARGPLGRRAGRSRRWRCRDERDAPAPRGPRHRQAVPGRARAQRGRLRRPRRRGALPARARTAPGSRR